MLLELYGQNFGCFRDEFRLSMLATDIDPGSDRGVVEIPVEGDEKPLRLLRAAAIYGPNASGKSTIVRAAAALRHLIINTKRLRSEEALRPYEPFSLVKELMPVRLGAKAVIDGQVYDYELQFDRTRFLSERLVWLNGEDGELVLLDRQDQDAGGQWMQDDRFALLTRDFRRNVLLLTLADQLAPSLAKSIARGLRRVLSSVGLQSPFVWSAEERIARRAREDSAFSDWVLSRLKSADVGVESLRTDEFRYRVEDEVVAEEQDAGPTNENKERIGYRLTLLHRGEEGAFPIPYHRESGGTKRLVNMSSAIYDLTNASEPGVLFIDEMDESLHPALLQGLIRHFNCETPMEEARGQLVFVTHETALLDAEAKNTILRRDQVYFTEKDASGASRLFSLAEFKERNNLNLRRRYLQGRYGALPILGGFQE